MRNLIFSRSVSELTFQLGPNPFLQASDVPVGTGSLYRAISSVCRNANTAYVRLACAISTFRSYNIPECEVVKAIVPHLVAEVEPEPKQALNTLEALSSFAHLKISTIHVPSWRGYTAQINDMEFNNEWGNDFDAQSQIDLLVMANGSEEAENAPRHFTGVIKINETPPHIDQISWLEDLFNHLKAKDTPARKLAEEQEKGILSQTKVQHNYTMKEYDVREAPSTVMQVEVPEMKQLELLMKRCETSEELARCLKLTLLNLKIGAPSDLLSKKKYRALTEVCERLDDFFREKKVGVYDNCRSTDFTKLERDELQSYLLGVQYCDSTPVKWRMNRILDIVPFVIYWKLSAQGWATSIRW